jgi:PAS domain S-box-containing protein
MLRLLKQNIRPFAAIAAFCIFLIGSIWLWMNQQLEADRRQTIAIAIQRNSNLCVALEQYAIRTIQNADAILRLIKSEYEQHGAEIAIAQTLAEHSVDKSFIAGVAIVNEKGIIVTSDFFTEPGAINLKDREHFQYHIKNSHGGLFIGKPIMSRTLRKAIIPLTRRLNKADGSFGGEVTVQIEPSTFTRFYAEANLKPHDIISLIAPDGATFSRRTGSRESYGENISKSPLFGHIAAQPRGNYFAKDAIRGVPTYFSYRKMENYPIIATVGAAEKEILSAYHQRISRDYLATIIISALILLFSLLVGLVLLHRKKNLDKVKESETRYRSVFESSQDAILLVLPCGQMLAANPAACRIFKMTAAQLCASRLWDLADPADPALSQLREEGPSSAKAKGELRFLRSDGSSFTGELTSAIHKDALENKRSIVIIRDITERKRMNEQLVAEQKRYQRRLTQQVILAQEREREVIGRELHDNVNQVLTTVKLYLELAMSDAEARDQFLPKSIQHIVESINEIRNLSRDLTAPTLGTKSLVDSVNALVEMVQSSSGLYIQFEHSAYHNPIPMDQKLAIYRIVQEQLNNIIKHANATEVLISLSQTATGTVLNIKDNGRGFDPSISRNGIGLNNILSRAKVFEGEVNIESSIGCGCMITISLPVVAGQNGEKVR